MNQVVIRQIITFSATKDSKIINLNFEVNIPADVSIPLPGDEVKIPDEVATKVGFNNGVFKVASRRFFYTNLPAGIGGVVSLLLSKED